MALTLTGAAPADPVADAEQHGDIDLSVTLDSAAASGHARAAVRIHADRRAVWALLKTALRTDLPKTLRALRSLAESPA